jgi:hypothetical protein
VDQVRRTAFLARFAGKCGTASFRLEGTETWLWLAKGQALPLGLY